MLFLVLGGVCRNLLFHLNHFRQKEVIFDPQKWLYTGYAKCNLEIVCFNKRMDAEA